MVSPGDKELSFCYHCKEMVIGEWQRGKHGFGEGILCPLCGNDVGVLRLDEVQKYIMGRIEAVEKKLACITVSNGTQWL